MAFSGNVKRYKNIFFHTIINITQFSFTISNFVIQSGSVSAPFTGTPYRVKYFKPISKEINQYISTV